MIDEQGWAARWSDFRRDAGRIIKDHTNREISILLLGQALRLGLGLISSALLARSLGPEGLRVFSVLGIGTTLLATAADFGLSKSAIRSIAADLEVNPDRARLTAETFSLLKLLSGLAMMVAVIFLAGPLSGFLGLPPKTGRFLIVIGGIWILAEAVSGQVSALLQALRKFSALMVSQTVNILLTVGIFGLLFMLNELQILNALVVGVVTLLAAAAVGWTQLSREWRSTLLRPGKFLVDEAARLWGFGRWIGLSTLFITAYVQVDMLLVNHWARPQEAGYYALALNLSLKANILVQTAHVVLLPQAAALVGREQIIQFLRRGLVRVILMAAAVAGTIPLAGPFIRLVYGPAFSPSEGVYILLAVMIMVDLLVLPIRLLPYTLNTPRLILLDHSLRLGGLLALGGVLVPTLGIYGAALAKILSDLLAVGVFGSALIFRWTAQTTP